MIVRISTAVKIASAALLIASTFWACSSSGEEPDAFLQASFQKKPIDLLSKTQIFHGDIAERQENIDSAVRDDAPGWYSFQEAPDGVFPVQDVFWLRSPLPEATPNDPSLHLSASVDRFEVFQSLDSIRPAAPPFLTSNQYGHYNTAIVELDPERQGKWLFIRIYAHASLEKQFLRKIRYGARAAIINNIMKQELTDVVVAFACLLIGLFAVLTFFSRLSERAWYILTFGLFALSLSLFLLLYRDIKQVIYDDIAFWFYIGQTGYFTMPIGLYAFFEQASPGKNRIVRILWQFHAVLAASLIILNFSGWVMASEIEFWYGWLLVAEIPIAMSSMMNRKMLAMRESRIFLFGAAVIGGTGSLDILIGLGYLPGTTSFFVWGLVVFILCLAAIIDHRFSRLRDEADNYSKLLEQESSALRETNAELEAQNAELERRVAVRSQELDRKNEDLESTLFHLKEMEKQLVLQQKMAALGRLAAGVARDIDEPLTVVSEASEVIDAKIEQVDSSESFAGVGKNGDLLRIIEAIDKENAAASEASKNIAQTVKALKNFARLDEADFQPVDPRRGLEDTLQLLQNDFGEAVTIRKELAQIPLVDCYPNQLNQVFMQILLVAAHGFGQRGEALIRTRPVDENIVIEFEFTASPDQSSFSGFFADVEKTFQKRIKSEDNLLDFSIIRDIIRRHGGSLDFERKTEENALFRIKLPAKPEEENDDEN